jgi:DNA-binding NarL/FixJ family response regulator
MRSALCMSPDQNSSRPRIFISDDHAMFTETLGAYLEKAFTVIGVLDDRRRTLLQEAIKPRPDVVVSRDAPLERTGRGPED